jgi:uncharacterized membrane protein YphA (DoxX/SURF4 family)
MKNIITQFSRIFVGILFIISGLIKLNDPIGFSYKLAEYFSEPVFNMPFFVPFALGIALFLVILEVVLGIMLLIAYKTKFTIWSLLILIVLFTFLTFYSAYFNVVKDCGCFGDALKLTPWQSFTKDIILLLFILILFFNQKLVKPLFRNNVQNIVIYASIVLSSLMGVWVLNHLPIIDFRPYKVGNNIQKGMRIPDGAEKSVVEMVFIYGSDYKDEFLEEPKLMLITAYDLVNADHSGMAKLEKLNLDAKAKGYKVVAMTASSPEEIAAAKKQFGLTFDFYFCDAITVKTIERANPSIVLLEKGTIKQKVHHNDIADLQF